MMKRLFTSESGQAFPMALVVLAMGSLFVGSFLYAVNTNFLISDVYNEPVPDYYTADAGIEDAIWGLQYSNLGDTIVSNGGSYSYTFLDTVNNDSANITVLGTGSGLLAHDDFEDHSWKGGTGWLDDWLWDDNKVVDVLKKGDPYQPEYHCEINGAGGNLRRSVNLTDYSGVHLQFWAKADLFEPGDTVYCQVSPDGINWTILQTWDVTDSDNTYRYYDLDLSAITMSAGFWVGFDSTMVENVNKDEDYFYFDVITLTTGSSGYTIYSTSGERTAIATVSIQGSTSSVLTWEVE